LEVQKDLSVGPLAVVGFLASGRLQHPLISAGSSILSTEFPKRYLMIANPKLFRWYYLAAAFYLLQTMQATGVVDRLVYGEWFGKPGDKITESLNLLLIGASLSLFVRAIGRRSRLRTGEVLLLALTGFLFLSGLWSVDPLMTLREAVIYLWVVLGAIGIAAVFDGDEFMELLRLTCCGAAVGSIVLLMVSPAAAMDSTLVDVRGVFANKEVLGGAMIAGVLASLHGIRVGNRRPIKIVMLAVFLALAFASHAMTRCLAAVALCGLAAVLSLARRGPAARLIGAFLLIVLVPIVGYAILNQDSIVEMLGKDPTLTGRTEIWQYVIPEIFEKPILGWGYGVAFWSSETANQLFLEMGAQVSHAHNTLLEILLEVGCVGAGFFIFLLVRNVVLSLRCLRTPAQNMGISSLLCSAGLCLVGISEVSLTNPEITTVTFFITGLMCERAVRAARRAGWRRPARAYA
jgi:O-antigen ligase